jgi:tRNA A37 threonylcarbamoyladenosine synthetase subunit TsaC/SUA5/YrdC
VFESPFFQTTVDNLLFNRSSLLSARTSANYSGEPTPLKLAEVDQSLIEKVDFVINGVCTMEGVSTIIDASNGKMEIVRQGVLVL